MFFKYLHEELGALGHEDEDEGRREAGDGAEGHKHPPALEVQRAQREERSGSWYHHPGQTWSHGIKHGRSDQFLSV